MKPDIAVIGSGYWGKNHVRNFAELGRLRVVCDWEGQCRTQLRQQYRDVAVSAEIKDVLTDSGVTAVVIATPAETHHVITREAILAGKDVLVEKPLALKVRDGRELAELAKASGRILM